jgi:hypothetical protein
MSRCSDFCPASRSVPFSPIFCCFNELVALARTGTSESQLILQQIRPTAWSIVICDNAFLVPFATVVMGI